VHCERNFKQQVKKTYLEKIDVQKNSTMLPIWTKFWNRTLEQRNKENRQKQSYKQLHVQNKKHPKKNAKHMQNQELKKLKIKKNGKKGQVGQLLVQQFFL
jgi:hypothetical protein